MKFVENDKFKFADYAGLRLVVPVWCNFIAADESGHCFCYSDKPAALAEECEWENPPSGAVWHIGMVDLEGADWKTTLVAL